MIAYDRPPRAARVLCPLAVGLLLLACNVESTTPVLTPADVDFANAFAAQFMASVRETEVTADFLEVGVDRCVEGSSSEQQYGCSRVKDALSRHKRESLERERLYDSYVARFGHEPFGLRDGRLASAKETFGLAGVTLQALVYRITAQHERLDEFERRIEKERRYLFE